MSTSQAPIQSSTTARQFIGIRRWNLIAGCAHLAQMIAILVLANDFTLPVTATYMSGPPGTPQSEPVVLFDIRVAWAIALFFGLSALFHFLLLVPVFYRRYAAGLVNHHNYFRWVEYSLSASVMIVLIAQLVGIFDVAALIAIFGVNTSMILFGWLQEKYEAPGGKGWLPFTFGCIAGIVPWLAVAVYVIAPGSTTDAEPPAFVYAIIISLFIIFNSFALVQFMQYKQFGKWSDYLYGERSYIALSLVAKSLLAWQIFAGTLAPGS